MKAPGPAPGQGPPWTWRSFALPPQDRWGRLEDGWWVRHHDVKPRVRPFHPVHRKTHFDSGQVQSRRITVIWCHEKRVVRDDDWRTMTQPPVSDTWVGYTAPFSRRFHPAQSAGRFSRVRALQQRKSEGAGLRRQ